jgi:FlaA1/EpsC-like NDP-sugar epimerase
MKETFEELHLATALSSKSDQWESFLGRPPFTIDRATAAAELAGKTILVTGAGGWIGSALASSIAGFSPNHLLLLEANERSLYELDAAMQSYSVRCTPILGSVTDAGLLAEIFASHKPQIVFHTAAFKHVPLIERHPFAAIENNVIGTRRVVEAAVVDRAEQLVLLSTDKAVDPVSMMGTSKRIAELLLLAQPSGSTRMKALRLGNVLGSGGSVLPLFEQQLRAGRPLTVTHPEVRRYFLTTGDAVALLLHVACNRSFEGVIVPELGRPYTIESLARYLIADRSAPIVFTQLRPGDKMCEVLVSKSESFADDHPGLLRAVKSPPIESAELYAILAELEQACRDRSLSRLLEAVSRAVPEYEPSPLILEGARVSA